MKPVTLNFLRSGALYASLWAVAQLAIAQQPQPDAAPLVGAGTQAVIGADLVAETSTLDEAVRQRTLSSPEAVQRMATDIYLRRRLTEQALEQKLDETPQVQRLLQIVRERVLADALLKQKDTQSQPTSPVLAKLALQIYQSNPQRFQQPERVRARHILIPLDAPDARAKAEALRKQALQGDDFATLAKKNSKDPGTAPKGGDLGFFTRGKMVKPFDEAVFALVKPGDVSDVIETRFGYHIIQLNAKHPAGLQTFEEVKEQLTQEAASGISNANRQEAVRPLLEAAKPHSDAIEAFSATYQ